MVREVFGPVKAQYMPQCGEIGRVVGGSGLCGGTYTWRQAMRGGVGGLQGGVILGKDLTF